MATLPTSPNANIQATTREAWVRSVERQVFRRMPLINRLLMKKKVRWAGGKVITRPVDKAELDDQAQDYTPAEGLRSSRKTFLENPYFKWKFFQVPVAYDIEEFIQNGGSADVKVVDFVSYLVEKAHRAALIKLYKLMYETAQSSTDAGKWVQGVRQALTHDVQYGHLTRTIGSSINDYWQGASIAETFADQATARPASVNTFRLAMSAVKLYVHDPADYLCVVGPTIHLALKSWVEAKKVMLKDGPLAKFGFNSFTLDGVEVVEDPYLKNSVLSNAHKMMFIFNVNTWQLRVHPERSFKMTPFVWQGDRVGGLDQWLARVLFAGNLVCWAPNSNIMLTNVT